MIFNEQWNVMGSKFADDVKKKKTLEITSTGYIK